jgi:hypothetical protein
MDRKGQERKLSSGVLMGGLMFMVTVVVIGAVMVAVVYSDTDSGEDDEVSGPQTHAAARAELQQKIEQRYGSLRKTDATLASARSQVERPGNDGPDSFAAARLLQESFEGYRAAYIAVGMADRFSKRAATVTDVAEADRLCGESELLLAESGCMEKGVINGIRVATGKQQRYEIDTCREEVLMLRLRLGDGEMSWPTVGTREKVAVAHRNIEEWIHTLSLMRELFGEGE